jgi:ATP-binding cassette subfamily C protein
MRRLPNNIFKVYKIVPAWQRGVVCFGLLVVSILEMLGIASMAPLLAAVLVDTGVTGRGKSFLTLYFRSAVEAVGLEFTFVNMMIVLLACFIIKSFLTVIIMRYVADLISKLTTEIRLDLIRNLLQARWSFFVRQKLGKLVAVAGHDTNVVGNAFYNISTLANYSLQVFIYILLAFIISWKLMVFIFATAAILAATFGTLIRFTRKQGQQHSKQMHRLAANFTDSIVSIKTIKAMGRHARFGRLFERDARAVSETMKSKIFSLEFASEIMEPVILVIFIVGMLVAIGERQVSFVEVMIMGVIFARSVMVINQIQRLHLRIVNAGGTYGTIVGVMNEAADQAEAYAGKVKPNFEHGCRMKDVTFSYEDTPVLKDANVEVPAGQITCFIGPSGVGKTTLVDLLLGLHEPEKGEIRIDDVPLPEIDITQWRNLVGYVSQEVILFHDSLYNNVTLGQDNFSEDEVMDALRAAGADGLIAEFNDGLYEIVGERGGRLSGGQRQRIAIARALIHKPKLLILDEATSALDPDTEQKICANIRQLVDETGLGVLSVSHQSKWRDVADKIYEIRSGEALPVEAAGQVVTG